ncbi:hypothetical protein AB0K81_02700 [Streptomyces werraensis]|uniref:Uncharacterized protein n=1 Tax=Streptomyces werraensis TaxID=68284 RepID=A0ABV3J833_9ACTN
MSSKSRFWSEPTARPALELHVGGLHLTVDRVPYWFVIGAALVVASSCGVTITWL